MLPKTPPDNAVTRTTTRTIYINPNFNKANTTRTTPMTQCITAATATPTTSSAAAAHINPLFLRPQANALQQQQQQQLPPAIHMNPHFFHQKLVERMQLELLQEQQQQQTQVKSQQLKSQQVCPATVESKINPSYAPVAANANSCKIISKSRMQLVRTAPLQQQKATAVAPIRPPPVRQQPLIRLSHLKLVRRSTALKTPISAATKNAIIAAVSSPASYPTSTRIDKYKIDRRRLLLRTQLGPTPLRKLIRRRTLFVARYALRRTSDQTAALSSSVVKRAVAASVSTNRKLQLLNINGVLYKSTRNTLQRKDVAPANSKTPSTSAASLKPKSSVDAATHLVSGRTLFVRGTKFVMDAQGFRLTRIAAPTSSSPAALRANGAAGVFKPLQRQRIDIGGLTYVASAATQNVFVRTRNHEALAHVNQARQRSLQLLWRARLVKSNVPCAIYKRVGRCVAHERGRCSKLHDKLQVTICPRFLRSECDNVNCLLSHNVSLSKMPVCRFFLQGVCVRADCPYLHKKLSQKADICADFLRGFCRLADQCEKRHEFLCPEYERNGKCETVNCRHCKKRRALETPRNTNAKKKTTTTAAASSKISATPPRTKTVGVSKMANTTVVRRYFNGGNKNSVTDLPTTPCEKNAQKTEGTYTTFASSDDDVALTAAPSKPIVSRPKVGILPAFIPLS